MHCGPETLQFKPNRANFLAIGGAAYSRSMMRRTFLRQRA